MAGHGLYSQGRRAEGLAGSQLAQCKVQRESELSSKLARYRAKVLVHEMADHHNNLRTTLQTVGLNLLTT